jgi:hypothetical protein
VSFPQSKYAVADMSRPLAWGCCDRCGFRYLRKDLIFQWDWRGNQLQNLRILVCTRTCVDVPFQQNRPIIIGPDPVPIKDPRPGFAASQQGYTPSFSVLEILDDDFPPKPPIQPSAGLYNDGGVLTLRPNATSGWPSSDPGIPGALWSNGLVITASLPVSPPPGVPPVYFSQTNSVQLLARGGNGITDVQPVVTGNGQIWVNAAMGGELWVV